MNINNLLEKKVSIYKEGDVFLEVQLNNNRSYIK